MDILSLLKLHGKCIAYSVIDITILIKSIVSE